MSTGSLTSPHRERHRSDRAGWLRAGVLGANDGIVSTAALVIGVAASNATRASILVAGSAGLVAGALSMAAGEYVSVSSQRDAELADISKEARELENQPHHELDELTAIYVDRGLEPVLARTVAEQLTAHDALGTHLRDELGLAPDELARPWEATVVSAVSFAIGAALPLSSMALASVSTRIMLVALVSLVCLAGLGAVGGRVGGAPAGRAAMRVALGGAIAMALSAGIGRLVGAAV